MRLRLQGYELASVVWFREPRRLLKQLAAKREPPPADTRFDRLGRSALVLVDGSESLARSPREGESPHAKHANLLGVFPRALGWISRSFFIGLCLAVYSKGICATPQKQNGDDADDFLQNAAIFEVSCLWRLSRAFSTGGEHGAVAGRT